MKTPDISTIHETVLHGDMRFHLMVHEFASDPSRSERVTSHWHEEYELLFLTEGNGTAHVNGRALPISAGDILFFNSGEVHSISAPPGVPLTFYAVVFGLDLISSYGNDDIQQKYIHRQTSGELLFQTVFHPKSPGTEPLRQSLEAIRSLYQEDFSSHELLIKAELLRIWHYLCRYPATQAFSVYPKDDSKSSSRKILRFIQEHYSSILTLEGLSATFHMSEGQFCRFFKSQVHMTSSNTSIITASERPATSFSPARTR
ncbi:MAG: AraC family ligand binding domain-containing protein [Lachnospiraceae bacterium]